MKLKKKTEKKSKKKFVYIKLHSHGDGATVYLSYKPWHEIFNTLVNDCDADNFDMKENGLIGKGDVYWSKWHSTYYCTETWVRTCYRKKGNGILLYKALMLAAVKLAKRANKKGKVTFSPHEAAGCSTTTKAWRAYKALFNRGYLKLKRKKKSKPNRKNKFVIARLPRNFKPFFYKEAS